MTNQYTESNKETHKAQIKKQAGVKEFGGRKDGTEPVNEYGEWVKSGKCIDF